MATSTRTRGLRRRNAAWAAVALVALVTVAACGSSNSSSSSGSTSNNAKGKTLKLGAVFSLTGGGGVYGPQQQQAVMLAQDTINNSGGVGGAHLSIQVVDDASDQTQSAQQTQTLIQQNQVMALLGPTLSNSAVAAHPIADNLKTPMLAVSTTGLNIVGNCPYPCTYIFRDSLGEQSAIPANVKVAKSKYGPKSAVLFYANDDKFSSDGATIFKSALASNGISIPDANVFQFSKTETDFSSFVTSGLGKSPDIVCISSLGAIPAKLMTELRKQGYTGPILGGNGFNTYQVSTQAGASGKGAQSGSAYFVGITSKVNQDFVKAYQAKYGRAPDQIAAQGYAAVQIFAEAAKNANLTFTDLAGDRSKLRDALEKVSVETPFGQFSFTSDHDVKQTIYVVAMDGNGGFTLVQQVNP